MNDKLLELLQNLGEKLSVKGAEAFSILVNGALLEGKAELAIASVLAAGVILFSLVVAWKFDDLDEPEGWMIAVVLAGLIGFIVAGLMAYDGYVAVNAPDYVALKSLIDAMRKH